MESKSLVRALPAVLLGSAAVLAVGTYIVLSGAIQQQTGKPVAVVTPQPESCTGKFSDLSWDLVDNDFSINMKGEKIAEVTFPDGGLFNAGEFYQVKSSSDYAYLDFNPDGLGGYILYPIAHDLIRVNLTNCKVDRLLDSTSAQGGAWVGLDISSDDEYLVGVLYDMGGAALTIMNTDNQSDLNGYPMPDGDYSQFDAKFSPDGSKIAVVGARGNPMSEQGILWIFDMETRTFGGYKGDEPIASSPGVAWTLNGWSDNETVDVESNLIN